MIVKEQANELEDESDVKDEVDIEKEISKEITGIRNAKKEALFLPVKIDVQCGKWYKNPSSFLTDTRKLCSSKLANLLSQSHLCTKSVRMLRNALEPRHRDGSNASLQ